jgi:hypothetical protein
MRRLGRYDFIDVLSLGGRYGLQVKSGKIQSPLTWQRAKVRDSGGRREASKMFETAAQELGGQILDYINKHMQKDLDRHSVDEIGYARLVIHKKRAFYFERHLISREDPLLFTPERFTWRWSEDRVTKSEKEQKGSLGGYDASGVRWFSWHSENQLHFDNERTWWPTEGDPHRIDFTLDQPKIDFETLVTLLESPVAETLE